MADTKLAKIGLTPKEPWAADISYEVLDVTLYSTGNGGDGCSYVAMRDNIGVTPGTDDSAWLKLSQAGQSIYDLAVKYHHFDGTEEEFEQQYQAVLQAARDAATATLATNTAVQNAETLRVAAEQGRVSAESARADAEALRASAELTRENNETARGNAESVRVSAESGRVTAENGRVSAESGRVAAESERASAETARRSEFESLESDMQTAIGQADAATAAAVALNEQVAGDEADRVAAETARETAESGRVSAESARVSAESGRVTAESGRVSAESARASAETARAAQASSDHTRAESDHGTAATDHTTAGADHTQAGADHTASEAATAAANTAAAAADAARESIQDDLARKANIDGSYDTMSVGIAKNLEGRTDVTGSFLERTTGGDAEVANGLAQMQEVGGKSQVWNQIVNGGQTVRGVTATFSNGMVELSGTLTEGTYAGVIIIDRNFIVGHKYFMRRRLIANPNNLTFYVNLFNQYYTETRVWDDLIITASSTAKYCGIDGATTLSDFTGVRLSFNVFDLTLIFGAGNEPETVAEFESWLEANVGLKDYYPYDAGTVLNVNITGIETLGFNLLDPATGKARIIGAYSDVYGNYYGITGTHGAVTFTSDLGETSTITPDSDGKFLLEEPGELTVADAGADCSVFLWWDGTKTDHEDYERTVTNLDVAHIYGKLNGTGELVRVWPTGMPGIGDVKDSLKVVDGQVVAERNVGEVDMGNLSWDILTADRGEIRSKGSSWGSPKLFGTLDHLINQVNIRGYISAFSNDDLSIYNMVVSFNRLVINDARLANMTSEQVVTALSGVLLYYELATPQTYTDLVYQGSALFADGTPVTMPTNYPVNNWSVERIVPQNSSEAVVTTAPELTCRYSIDAVETLNTHADEIENLYDELEELDAKKPNKVGDYPGLSVGTARNLSAENAVPAEYVFRKTPDGAATGIATVQRLKGKSVVWNQMFNHYAEHQYSVDGCTFTQNLGRIVAVLTEDKDVNTNYSFASGSISFIKGHKYYINGYIGGTTSASGTARVWVQSSVAFPAGHRLYSYNGGMILDALENEVLGSNYYSCQLTPHTPTGTYVFNPILFDLTQMFGAGNEPSTVEEFEAMYPLPYYEYNEGEIINNAAEAIETVGFNQWDEEWELGSISSSTGLPIGSSTMIRSKNYIPAFPSTVYYLKTPNNFGFAQYDAEKNFIGMSGVSQGTYTTKDNCRYLKFYVAPGYGTTYNNDICINLSDPAKNGTYEPYEKHTLQLGLDAFDVKDSEDNVITVNGLKSAGSVYDEIDLARGKYIKRVGSVDLGSLEWTYNSTADHQRFYATLSAKSVAPSVVANIINAKYLAATFNAVYGHTQDKIIALSNNGLVAIYDSSYSDAATFKTAMSGVTLYYELAEPVEYDLVNPIQTNYNVISGGTERRLPEDTASSVIAPIAYDVVYALDAVGILTGLPQNYVSKESLQAMLTAMQSAGIFSAYTMTWDATNQRYTFTFTNNS